MVVSNAKDISIHIKSPTMWKSWSSIFAIISTLTLSSVAAAHSVFLSCMQVMMQLEDSSSIVQIPLETTVHGRPMPQEKAVLTLSQPSRPTINRNALSRKPLFWLLKSSASQWTTLLPTLRSSKSESSQEMNMVMLFKEELKVRNLMPFSKKLKSLRLRSEVNVINKSLKLFIFKLCLSLSVNHISNILKLCKIFITKF